MTYLDWAASAPPDPRAVDEAREASLLLYANPSSPHAAGRQSADALAAARAGLAGILGARPDEISFTSGGTESNTSVLLALLDRLRLGGEQARRIRVVVTAVEHASVFDQARDLERFGFGCAVVRPGADGIVAPAAVSAALDADTVLVAAMLVNNETGAVQRIPEISAAVREASSRSGRRIHLHVDAVQALAKIPLRMADLGADTASFSGHKLGAPRGIGCLYVREGVSCGFLARGGGQEKGRRPGTENLPGARALARAARDRVEGLEGDSARARELAGRLIAGIRAIPGGVVFPEARRDGEDARFSPWIVSFGFPPVPGEVVVRLAEARGFLVGTGSACSSKKKDRTRVMEAMGLASPTALSAVRVSTGPSTTAADIDGLLDALAREVPPVRALSRGTAR